MIEVGDCLKLFPTLPDASVDLIVTDPPYNIGVDYGQGAAADRRPDFLEWCGRWIAESFRVLKSGGAFWLIINDEWAAELCVEAKRRFTLRNWVKWYETFGVNCTSKFNRTSRHCFYFAKGQPKTFNADAVRRRSRRQDLGDKRADPRGKILDDVWIVPRLVGNAKERLRGFPAQLPLDLVRPIIAACSNEGEVVFDLFNGSGTVGHAALESGRCYIGFELNEAYAAAAKLRLDDVLKRRLDELQRGEVAGIGLDDATLRGNNPIEERHDRRIGFAVLRSAQAGHLQPEMSNNVAADDAGQRGDPFSEECGHCV